MFTGIIQGVASIVAIEEKLGFRTHIIRMPEILMEGLKLGASVSHNGCCLTVTNIKNNLVYFDVIEETRRLTNLNDLQAGDEINIERAAKFGDEIGGHLMSGHIITTAVLTHIHPKGDTREVFFSLIDSKIIKYLFRKGFIGVDGASLTIVDVNDEGFSVALIPETLNRTLLGKKRIGDRVNIEIDPYTQVLVDTAKRFLTYHEVKNTPLQH